MCKAAVAGGHFIQVGSVPLIGTGKATRTENALRVDVPASRIRPDLRLPEARAGIGGDLRCRK